MTSLPAEVLVVAVALAASLALGVPVRLVGLRATLRGIGYGLGYARRHKFALLLLAVIGAGAGLWTFDNVRELVFGWIF